MIKQRKHAATREDILVEQSLVEKAQQGDTWAIGQLYEAHVPMVRRLLVNLLGPDDHIDDLSQDVFIQVFHAIHAFRGESRFSTWLHRIAANTALSHLRKKRRTPRFVDDTAFPSVPATQHREYSVQAELRELYTILDTLSPKRRIAFILFEIEEYTISEIVAVTGSNVATVKSRLFFGRRDILKKAAESQVLRELMDASSEGNHQ